MYVPVANDVAVVSHDNFTQNDQFTGYCVDIWKATAATAGLRYKLIPYNTVTGPFPGWTGMVQAVEAGMADGIVAPLTITEQRRAMVFYTTPFISSGLALIVPSSKKAEEIPLWGFAAPFTWDVYVVMCLCSTVIGVTFSYLESADLGGEFEGSLVNRLKSTIWFAFASVFFAHENGIHTLRGRVLLWCWLFVILVVTASYTANTASFLTAKSLLPDSITSLEDCRDVRCKLAVTRGYYYLEQILQRGFLESEVLVTESDAATRQAVLDGTADAAVDCVGWFDQMRYPHFCGLKPIGQTFFPVQHTHTPADTVATLDT